MDEAAFHNQKKTATWLGYRILEGTILATFLGGVPSLTFYHTETYFDKGCGKSRQRTDNDLGVLPCISSHHNNPFYSLETASRNWLRLMVGSSNSIEGAMGN
jgi:hypothetical protein